MNAVLKPRADVAHYVRGESMDGADVRLRIMSRDEYARARHRAYQSELEGRLLLGTDMRRSGEADIAYARRVRMDLAAPIDRPEWAREERLKVLRLALAKAVAAAKLRSEARAIASGLRAAHRYLWP